MIDLNITEEQQAEYSRNRALHKATLTLAYQPGMYVDQNIRLLNAHRVNSEQYK